MTILLGILGDDCTASRDADCSDAVDNSICDDVTSTCVCGFGYYVGSDVNSCIRRKIFV